MKQFINIYIISFVLILSQLSLFSSCKDEDTVAELKLDRTAIQIKEGSEGILKIESGSGATAKYRENLIYIQGVKYGKVVLNVTDLEGHSVSLDVVVVSSVLSTDNQRFVWGNMIELNKANNWSLFTDVNSVAITNVMEGRQYVLSCDGDLSVGVKSNATLEILSSKTGAEPEIVQLAGMEVLQIKDGLCSIVFSTADRMGELVFQK